MDCYRLYWFVCLLQPTAFSALGGCTYYIILLHRCVLYIHRCLYKGMKLQLYQHMYVYTYFSSGHEV